MPGAYPPGHWDQGDDDYVVQDGTLARIPTPNPRGGVAQQVPPPPPALTLVVIGSPSRGQSYQFQFVTAALCRPRDGDTIWLVEKSGYEIYGVSLDHITTQAPRGGYGWITPEETLVGWLNSMPDGSIKNLFVYSHGLRGLIALRYGWGDIGAPDYGLRVNEIRNIEPRKFADNPTIQIDSCNAGVSEGGSSRGVAQELANQIRRSVSAWTGRTSYADVNRGTCGVRGSQQSRNPLSGDFWAEWQSRRIAGGAPELRIFQPEQPR